MKRPAILARGDLERAQLDLISAMQRGAHAKLKKMLAEGVDVRAPIRGRSLLMNLMVGGQESPRVLEALLDAGCDIRERDKDGHTLLFAAITHKRSVFALELLRRGAPVGFVDSAKKTELHWACASSCSPELVRALVEAGAPVDARDRRGFTALHYAAESGLADVCRALIGAGADMEARTVNGNTPLHKAAENSHMEALEALLAAGASPSQINRNAHTPLERHRAYAGLTHLAKSPPRDVKEGVEARLGSAELREELGVELPRGAKKAPKGL